MTKIIKIDPHKIDTLLLSEAADVIKHGGLVAFPTETVYGLGADTFNDAAVRKIFAAKGRPVDNPLISHISKMEDIERFASEIPQSAIKLANEFWGGPLTMILKKRSGIPDSVTAGLNTVAIRLPSHSIANELIRLSGTAIAAPSANLSGSPSPTTARHCIDDLYGRVDMIIDGGDSIIGIESTVIDLSVDVPTVLRPGMISAEELREVIGEVNFKGEDQNAPKCPGMKYKHYSPKAEVYIFNSPLSLQKHIDKNAKACIIAKNSEEMNLPHAALYDAGKSDTEYAARLFYLLRKADEDGFTQVFAQMPENKGIGAALINRLMKSASGRVLD